jgi:hypothetical protein
VIWEFLNAFARIRWIYTVPFFEDLKAFEMPVPGFLGFLPFALECTVLYALLVGLGLAPGIQGFPLGRGPASVKWLRGALGGILGGVFGFLVLLGMEKYTVDSYIPRPGPLNLPAVVVHFAEKKGLNNCFHLREALNDSAVREDLEKRGADVKKIRDLLDLALLRGIGSEHAAALAAIGVDSVADLAVQDPVALLDLLSEDQGARERRVRLARIKVWIKGALEMSP